MLGNRLLLIAASILFQWIAFACLAHAASQSQALTIGYSSFSGHDRARHTRESGYPKVFDFPGFRVALSPACPE